MNSKVISKNYLDEHVVKLVALQVIAITVLILYSRNPYPAIFLTLDFALRAFTGLLSPLAFMAKLISASLHLKSKPVFAAPKRFAATLGFIFSLSATVLVFLKLENIAFFIAGALVCCAFLETVFNLCVGCYVYNWLIVPLSHRRRR